MENRKLTLFSYGNFVQTTRISAKVRYKQGSLMKLSYFLDSLLKYRISMFVHYNWPKLPRCENTEKSRTDGAFKCTQCL